MLQLAELVKTWNALNYLPIAIKPLGSHVTGWDLDFGIGIFVLIYRGFWICLGVKYVFFSLYLPKLKITSSRVFLFPTSVRDELGLGSPNPVTSLLLDDLFNRRVLMVYFFAIFN